MKIKIYQIDMERDEHRIAMMGYEETLARLNSDSIDSALYDLVFDGEIEAKDLEAVYAKFNLDHPAGYTGRSMSVSDVVEVVESTTCKEGYYFCDSIGFKEIPFQPELTKNALPRTIDVVLVEPGKLAHPAKITATLEGMQAVVGGDIEPFYPFEEQVCIVCNEEGKLIGLEGNRRVGSDIIAGVFYIMSEGEDGDLVSLSEEKIQHYTQRFWEPEVFGSAEIEPSVHVWFF